ncbi:helix-turn-helix domain-containing protein [Actinomycetospora sp. TBRC 11914]|uniref:helix-turn-helix domain-containing protein n=1 Tax=Actinomycetospora sp. TBRC 11914 TaxID=2729387 RepID=UPI00145DF89A|nr:helix-turn-helix transcriptional regulator [Actinomycetospora sp. TBRC 11914]NMO88916.1 helix-turn-helix transcriptional regulator [Actinomycetospora sp. TBRC 11914]
MGEVIPLESRRRRADPPAPASPAPTPLRRAPAPADEPLWREALGRGLRDLRHARGDRLADTAERAGMSPQYLSELERGRKDPSSEMLAAVAGALGVPVRDVVRRAHAELALGRGSRGPVLLAA